MLRTTTTSATTTAAGTTTTITTSPPCCSCDCRGEHGLQGQKNYPGTWSCGYQGSSRAPVYWRGPNLPDLSACNESVRWLQVDGSPVSFDGGAGTITIIGRTDLARLGNLLWLDAGRNSITRVGAGSFDDLTQLETLTLQRNAGLRWLPPRVLDKLTHLTALNLEYCRLTNLPLGLFDHSTRLRFLELSGNRLTRLEDGVFSALASVERLSVAKNRISSIPLDLFANQTAKLMSTNR